MSQDTTPHHPEHPHTAHEILQDPEFVAFARRKTAVSLTLTVVTMVVYFGFVGLLAFSPSTLGASVGSATAGIPIGICVIFLAWLVTGLYVRWANSTYDAQVEELKKKVV